MSRVAIREAATAIPSLEDDSENECPICHTKRYLRRDMRFLINPECYHKMCESCVDRIFKSGPAPCPVAGCHRTLRRNKFRRPTFGDLQLEREVDIRKNMAQTFNRREDEFDSLLDYNNYLNYVEDLTFNLIYKIDLDQTEAKVRAYKDAHDKEIRENIRLETELAEDADSRYKAEQEAARLRRQAALREEQEERREREEARLDIINKLASGDGDAEAIAREGQRVILKKSRNRQAVMERKDVTDGHEAPFEIKGLKKRVQAAPEKPFDPFDSLQEERDYYVQQDDYHWEYLDHAKTDPAILAGGYDLREYFTRALCEAFSGLGVFIGEEMSLSEAKDATLATHAAADAGASTLDSGMDDVF